MFYEGFEARESSKLPGGLWGGPGPVSTGILTFVFNFQDGMPANFLNRHISNEQNSWHHRAPMSDVQSPKCFKMVFGMPRRVRTVKYEVDFSESRHRVSCVLRGILDATSSPYRKIPIQLDVGPLGGSFLNSFGLPRGGVNTESAPEALRETPWLIISVPWGVRGGSVGRPDIKLDLCFTVSTRCRALA